MDMSVSAAGCHEGRNGGAESSRHDPESARLTIGEINNEGRQDCGFSSMVQICMALG